MSIILEKGQKISLSKNAGSLEKVIMGLGWQPAGCEKGISGAVRRFCGIIAGPVTDTIDLDASCLACDASGQLLDKVWFRKLIGCGGAITHTGDNTTGDGAGDDERIIVNLSEIPLSVSALFFVVNSFSGHTFDMIEKAFCRAVNIRNGKELARFALSSKGGHTALIMSKLTRHTGTWQMEAIGEPCMGRTADDIVELIPRYL